MPLETRLRMRGLELNEVETRRINRRLQSLGRRLAGWPDPTIALALGWHAEQRQAEARLRLRLGHLGPHLVSRRTAETADLAVRLALDDVKRQLERELATRRGEPTFGVPSRRAPRLEPVQREAEEAGAAVEA